MQVAAVSSAVSAWYAKNSGKKVSDLMKTLTISDAGSVAEFVEKAAEVIPEPDAEYVAKETAAVAEMTEIANKELKKTTVDEKAVPDTVVDGIKIDEDGSIVLPTAAEEWDAALKRSEAETLLYLKKLDASVLADGGVSTTELSDLLKDKNTARSIFVEYSKSHFPSSITNLETGHEIGISRNGIDKFLSGNISKEKYATGLKIPQLVESAHKVAEADNKKGKAGISGYEYYENKIKVDGNDYNVYIRVRNTDMGDRYYGHTIGKAVEDIKIEPSAWNSDGDTSVHSINALDSDNIIPQRTPGVKMANDGSIMLPTAEGEINAAAANKKDILPGFSDVTTETTEMTGRACGVSEENIGIAVRLSHALGVKVAFYEDLTSDERGQYLPKTGVIWVNSKYQDVFSNVFGHELTHKIESSRFYKALDRVVAGKLKAEGKSMDELIRRKKESYGRRGASLSDEAARREVVAKYVGEVLLNNEAVIADIANTDRGLGGFLLSKIDSLVAKITGKNKEAVYIRRVQQMFRKALEDVSRKEGAKVSDGSKQQRGSVYEDAGLNELAERYRRGDLSQAEYLEAYNEYMERNPGLEDDGEFDRSFDLDEDSFINQLEDWKKYKGKKGGSYNGTYFDLGTTPDVFTKHGASAHQLIMLEECLIKVTGGKHAISTDELKKLPSELNDPILLFKSSYTGKNGKLQKAFVALTEMVDIHNNDVVVAIHIDKYQDRLIVNKISSLYSKSDDITFKNRIISYVNNQISAGNLIDASTKKAPIWFTSRGLQLPKLVQTIIDANNSISQNKGFVNTQNKNNSGMQNNENAPDASKRFHRVLKQDYNGQYDFDDANDFVDDETYMDAVNRGDMDTAQRLVEKAAKESGRTVKVYHGTPRFGFTKLDTRKSDDRISVFATSSLNLASTYSGVDNERQINTANDKDVYTAEDVNRVEKAIEAFVEKANSIAQTEIANSDSVPFHKYLKQIKKGKDEIAYKIKKLDEFDFFAPIQVEQVIDDVADIAKSNNLADATKQLDDLRRASEDVINAIDEMKNAFSGNYGFYADVDNLLEVEGNGANWKEIPFDMIPGQKTADTREIAEWAKKNGYAGVQFKNIYDSGGRTNLAEASDVYAFFNPKTQLKSADPVTYDNKGKVIPLSKRFNYNNSDIRYDFDDANDYSSATGVVTAEKAEEKPAKSTRRTRKADTRKATEDRLFNKRELERLAKIKSELEDADELTVEQVTSLWGEMRKLQRNVTAMSMAHQITNEELTQVTDLLRGDRTIEDIEKLPADRYNIDGIIAVAKAKLEYENVASQIREYKARHKARLYEVADGYVAGNVIDDKKGPAAGLRYRRETMERNVRDVVKDKDKAEGIIDEYFKPVHKNEADRTRFKEKLRDRIRKLGISTKVEKGNQVSEAYAVQFYGEVADNIAYLEQNQNRVKHREGKNLEEWRALEKALWEDNPNLDKNKIVRAVEEFRKIYDELYQNMNEVRVRNGYEPVKYRRGYFPHFAPGTSDGVLAKIAKGLGINSEVTDLPTTINGLTHTFKPGIKWMGNILARTGFATEYDALTGFDRYLEAASDVIFHTDDIQRLRALSSRIRYNASDDGIKKRADAISKNEELREEEKQAALDGLYKEGKFTGSNFTVVLDDYTNILAGKKSISDRNAEYNLGRKMYNVVKGLESRIAANMIAGNLASALTNFIPITQAVSVIRLDHVLHGAFNTVLGKDGMQDMSDFLVNRRGSDLLTETTSEWISKKLSKPMEFIDSFASGFIVRARYYENLQRGLSEDAALEEADSFAASVIADRSKGSMPVLFEQKNPLMKLFTQFQLEVNNQLSFATKDLWRYESAKAETGKNRLTNKVALRYVWGLFWFAIMAFLFDELYEWLIGRRPALDPIGMALDYADDAQEDGWFEALGGLGEDVAENMPFIGGLMGGGRVPISSALPDINKIYNSLSGDANWKKKAVTVGKEISKPFIYLVPPFGGGLGKKVIEGASGMIQGGSYTADSDGNAELQYPIYKDSVGDTIWNGAKSVLFGRTSTAGGKKWIKDGFKNFTADYTEAYKDMIELDGVSQKEAYEFLDGLRNVKDPQKGDDVSVDDLKRQYIEESGIDDSAKGIAYYYALASENEKDVLDSYRDSEEFGAISGVLMGMKEHGNSVQPKRELLLESELDSSVKRDIYESIIVSSDDKEKESAKIDAFEDAGMTVDDYLSCRNKKYELDNDDGLNASGRATEFARWVDNNFKPKQAGIIKENVKFSSGFSVSADGYEKYREAGLSPDEAYNLINGFGELEPEDGKEQVSDWQKARVIVDGDLSDEDKLTSLGVVLSSGTYERVSTAYDKGISFERYFDVKDEYDSKKANYSADEKDAYADRWNSTHGRTSGKTKLTFNQIMMYEAIEGIGGDLTASGGIMTTAPKYSFTKRDKAVLWQILDGEWSHEKNPFDTSVGLDVRKSMGWVD